MVWSRLRMKVDASGGVALARDLSGLESRNPSAVSSNLKSTFMAAAFSGQLIISMNESSCQARAERMGSTLSNLALTLHINANRSGCAYKIIHNGLEAFSDPSLL